MAVSQNSPLNMWWKVMKKKNAEKLLSGQVSMFAA
jgi:hypothetical protein